MCEIYYPHTVDLARKLQYFFQTKRSIYLAKIPPNPTRRMSEAEENELFKKANFTTVQRLRQINPSSENANQEVAGIRKVARSTAAIGLCDRVACR